MRKLSFFYALVFFSSDPLVSQPSYLAWFLPPILVERQTLIIYSVRNSHKSISSRLAWFWS